MSLQQEQEVYQERRKYKITGMAWPLCPDCKSDTEPTKDPFAKRFRCTNPRCGHYFEKRELLSGWMINTFLKQEFIDKIWTLIISEVKENHEEAVRNTKRRLEFAKTCKWYCHECEENFRCKNPEEMFNDEKIGHCYFAAQYPNECYEKNLEDK